MTTARTNGTRKKTTLQADPKRKGVYAEVELVTPERAAEILEKFNPENRNLNRHQIETISDAIVADEWMLNGQTIGFDWNGMLQNGQQRLSAIVRAEKPAEVLVVYNLDPKSRATVDIGRKRTVADEFMMRGEANPIALAAILMMKKRIELQGRGRNVALTTIEAIKLLDQYPNVREAAELAQARRSDIEMPASVIGYCTLNFRELSIEQDNRFWDVFASGLFDGSGDPRFVYQRTIQRLARDRNFSTGVFTNKIALAALTTKAWNAFRADREIKVIRWLRNESFPKAV